MSMDNGNNVSSSPFPILLDEVMDTRLKRVPEPLTRLLLSSESTQNGLLEWAVNSEWWNTGRWTQSQ